MKRNLLLIILIGIITSSIAQVAADKYYIQFTDKNDSPYSIDNPSEYLTQRALNRRDRQGIQISQNDIPVNATYLQGVADIGVDLLNSSRWLNGVTVYTEDTSLISLIEALPYVSETRKFQYTKNFNNAKFKDLESDISSTIISSSNVKSTNILDYGLAYGQIEQLNGIPLHEQGYQGQGMVIAVLDAGFTGVLEHQVFDYLWDNDRILGTKDFVHMGGDVFQGHEHGKMVLSCMGANLPGEMVGTAPEAHYWLLRPEEGDHENVIEEYNWVSAAEFADSVGADVINSSLSYIDFDLPQWDHFPEEMDGNTAIATIGADIAAAKGILVVNSAGNSYPEIDWLGAPADGDSVFTVGAVDLGGQRASFSSTGPTADGRIKPTAMACGAGATIAVGNNDISTSGYGTSFSSPIMAGMSTCLWQSHLEMTPIEVIEAIQESSSNASNPDRFMGWGIPNFYGADSILTAINPPKPEVELVKVSPNPFQNHLNIVINIDSAETVSVELVNLAGDIVISRNYSLTKENNKIDINSGISSISQGIYFLKVITKSKSAIVKLIKV